MRKVDAGRHEEKRTAILDAAMRCFVRNGFHGSSVADLCAEAGMSPGHLYHYFRSKEAIVEAMVAANLRRAARTFEDAAGRSGSVLDVILTQLRHDGRDAIGRAPLLFDMLGEAGRSPAIAKALHEHSRGMTTLLVDLLRRGQAAGEVDETLDPERVAPLLIGLMDGSMALVLRDPTATPQATEATMRMLLGRFFRAPE